MGPISSVSRQLSQSAKFQCPDSLGLPLGDINILVVTDIHAWIAGQHIRHEPEMNVDFGGLVSLYQRIVDCAPEEDFFFLFNGDFMDGTGLSTVPPEYLGPLMQRVPFSALNVGNHELYFNEVVDYMVEKGGFIDSWKGNYLASNVDYVKKGTDKTIPFGSRYTFLHGANRKSTILTFGFLYNFFGNCNHTKVQLVEEALEEEWFVQVLTQPPKKYNAIIVMGHFDAVDDLVYTILDAVRTLIGSSMPIYFITGHTHRRHYEQLDPLAATLEAGRFMDTIGFASFPLKETAKELGEEAFSLYQHRMLNANMDELTTSVFKRETSTRDFYTRGGRALTVAMQHMQKKLGLLEVVTHCAPQALLLEKPIEDERSLWWFYVNQVVPKILFPIIKQSGIGTDGSLPIFLQGTGALRYSLFGPTIVVDDIIAVSPFENPIMQIGANLTAKQLNQVFEALQVDGMAPKWELKNFGIAGERPDPTSSADYSTTFDLYTVEFHVKQVLEEVQSALLSDGDTEKAASVLAKPVYQKGKGYKDYHQPLQHKEVKKKAMDATNLWFEFFHNEWKCPTNHNSKGGDTEKNSHRLMVMTSNFHSNESIPSVISTLAAVFLILLYALGTTRRRRTPFLPRSDAGLQLARREPIFKGEAMPLLPSSNDESGSRSYSY